MKVTVVHKDGTQSVESDWICFGWYGFWLKIRIWLHHDVGYSLWKITGKPKLIEKFFRWITKL
jgi:hypothetical protein